MLALATVVLDISRRRSSPVPDVVEEDCIVPLLWLVGTRSASSSISSIVRGKGSVGRLIFGGMPPLALLVRPAGIV